jgi:hypothetical protein
MLRRSCPKIGKEAVAYGGIFLDPRNAKSRRKLYQRQLFHGRLGLDPHWKKVSIASGVQIITGSHAIGDRTKRGAQRNGPLFIGDKCWLGAACVVLPGVSVAAGCVIGAGAIVTKSTCENGLYAGSPARKLRDLGADAPNALSAFDALSGPINPNHRSRASIGVVLMWPLKRALLDGYNCQGSVCNMFRAN